jgi:thiamine-phosphate pyrophosphorylase
MTKADSLRGLYGITSPALCNSTTLIEVVDAALEGGMRILQYRNKTLDFGQQLLQAGELKKCCQNHAALFIINDDLQLAQAVDADGVHLGKGDIAIDRARQMLGESAIIGCSCYNELERAVLAQEQGADYVAFGRFYASLTKPLAIQASLDILQQARSQLDIPVCAIGGITVDNASALIEQGADMIAVINGLFSADDIQQRAHQLSSLLH